jgi:hypothetical protein
MTASSALPYSNPLGAAALATFVLRPETLSTMVQRIVPTLVAEIPSLLAILTRFVPAVL